MNISSKELLDFFAHYERVEEAVWERFSIIAEHVRNSVKPFKWGPGYFYKWYAENDEVCIVTESVYPNCAEKLNREYIIKELIPGERETFYIPLDVWDDPSEENVKRWRQELEDLEVAQQARKDAELQKQVEEQELKKYLELRKKFEHELD